MRYRFGLVWLLLLVAHSIPASGKIVELNGRIDSVKDLGDASAVDFLEYTKSKGRGRIEGYWKDIHGWVKEQDIPKLIDRLTSTAPCMTVACWKDFQPGTAWVSTEGAVAAGLILEFAYGDYPPPETYSWRENVLPRVYDWLCRGGNRFVSSHPTILVELSSEIEQISNRKRLVKHFRQQHSLQNVEFPIGLYEWISTGTPVPLEAGDPYTDRTMPWSDGGIFHRNAIGQVVEFEWKSAEGKEEHALFQWKSATRESCLLRFCVNGKDWLDAKEHDAKLVGFLTVGAKEGTIDCGYTSGVFEYSSRSPCAHRISLKPNGTSTTRLL